MTSSDTHPPVEPADWWLLREMIEEELASIGEPVSDYGRNFADGLRGALAYMSGIERARTQLSGDLVQAVEQ